MAPSGGATAKSMQVPCARSRAVAPSSRGALPGVDDHSSQLGPVTVREPLPPRLVATNQVSGPLVAKVRERCCSQARRVSSGAHDDDRLPETPDVGQAMVRCRVQAPLEDVALHDQGAGELAFLRPLRRGSDVDDEPTLGDKSFELVRADATDTPPSALDEVVDGGAHATAWPKRYCTVAPVSSLRSATR